MYISITCISFANLSKYIQDFTFHYISLYIHEYEYADYIIKLSMCRYNAHTRMVLSPLPEYSFFPTAVRQYTPPVCPCKVVIC